MAINATITPSIHATVICDRECWRKTIRLVPTTPDMINVRHNHHIGLKSNISANTINAPATPPIAAACTETFHHTFIIAHINCINSAATSIPPIK